MRRSRSGFFGGVITGAAGALLVTGIITGGLFPQKGSFSDTEYAVVQANDKLEEINKYIDDKFIFDTDSDTLSTAMLKGYISGLGDRYSAYYTEEEMEQVLQSLDGGYYGIGVQVEQQEDGSLRIVDVYSNSPAKESGLEAEDLIVGVSGIDVEDMELETITSYIKGAEGTYVELTIRRGTTEFTVQVERRDVSKDTVHYRMLEDNIGYLQLTSFDEVSLEQLTGALLDLTGQGMTSLVLDLRDNPGGLLTSVVDIADIFLPKDEMVLYIEEKDGTQTEYRTENDASYDGPMVVLVNENSASAAEVLSGALKDYERATLIGTTTFGKGIVQSYYNLSDGSGLKITTAHYFTPAGHDIHGVGITPDIEVEQEATDEDQTSSGSDTAGDGGAGGSDTENENGEDVQLARAVEELR